MALYLYSDRTTRDLYVFSMSKPPDAPVKAGDKRLGECVAWMSEHDQETDGLWRGKGNVALPDDKQEEMKGAANCGYLY